MPLRNLVLILLAAVVSLACYQRAIRNRYVATFTEALKVVEDSYVEEVDSRVLFEGAMNGMMQKLDYPYSSFIPPEEYQSFRDDINQEFGGIGIFVEVNAQTKRLTIMSPKIGTPAFDAGLKAGDIILAINGEDTEALNIRDCVSKMRGPIGAEITLTIQHADDSPPQEYTLKRARIPIESVYGDTLSAEGSWDFHLDEDRRLGYIRIVSFGEQTSKEVLAAIESFRDEKSRIQGLIVDLRGNGGGLLTAAVETCDMFLDDGVIVTTRGRDGVKRDEHKAEPGVELDRNIPMVVLVDRYSASASEIVAACLQDDGRAVICGQRTWGKGTVQNLMTLEGGKSAMRITTATYWRPSNKNIHKKRGAKDTDEWGVLPSRGLDVALSDEELERVLRQRREKDFAALRRSRPATSDKENATQTASDEPPQPKTDDDPTAKAATAKAIPFEDPQLRKAVEYLREKLK